SAFRTKLVCDWILITAGRASSLLRRTRLFAAREYLAPDQRIKVLSRFDAVNVVQHSRGLCAHFTANFLVVFFRQLAALVLEVEILDIPEDDIFLPLQKVPLGFFNDGGFE